MRITSARRARAAAVLTTAAALGGLSLAAAPAANAVVLDPLSASMTVVQFDDDPDLGVTCNGTGTGDKTVSLPLVADGLPHTVTVSSDATDTNAGDATDVTSATGTSSRTMTVSQAGGQLSHISVSDSFSATMASSKGAAQKCNLGVSVGSQAQLQFDLVKPTYVSVSATAHGMVTEAIVASNLDGLFSISDASLLAVAGGKHGTGEGHLLLPAGTSYIGVNIAQGGALAPTGASGDSAIEISFDEPGLAATATTGNGKKYVDLPNADNCATGTAVATWKAKAGKKKHSNVQKAIFKVESAKVGSAKKPVKKKTTTLKALPVEGPFTITGKIKLTSGKTVTVSRDYQACS
jgi:hypothetical protein